MNLIASRCMMDREEAMLLDIISRLRYSIPICYANIWRDFLCPITSFFRLPSAPPPTEEEEEEDDGDDRQKRKNSNDGDRRISDYDMRVVVERLGMVGYCGGGGGLGREVVEELLEEKRASVEELREAFYVFDKNEDGFVSPGELWCVMRRLGLPEGLRLGDCERMIRAFDEDGDGRISFDEFARLMEDAA